MDHGPVELDVPAGVDGMHGPEVIGEVLRGRHLVM